MKSFASLTLLAAGLLLAGCASHKNEFTSVPGPSGGTSAATTTTTSTSPQPQPQPAQSTAPSKSIVTPDNSLSAKVVAWNNVGRFVVLNVSGNQMPAKDQTLFLYRGGLKVGELKISGEQGGNLVVADLVSGEAQVGDEARDQ